MRKVIIGIIGGIGSGKSTVARYFEKLGARVINADKIAHSLLEKKIIKREVVKRFSKAVIKNNGRIDKTVLAQKCFESLYKLRNLERILHPRINKILHKNVQKIKGGIVVVDAPLLLEAGCKYLCNKLVFVDAPLWIRKRRLANSRKWNKTGLKKRESFQISPKIKEKKADYIIDNTGSKLFTLNQVKRIYNSINKDFTRR